MFFSSTLIILPPPKNFFVLWHLWLRSNAFYLNKSVLISNNLMVFPPYNLHNQIGPIIFTHQLDLYAIFITSITVFSSSKQLNVVTLAKEYVVFSLIQLKSFYYNNPGSSPGTRRSAREFGPGTRLSALELGSIERALELRFLGLAVTLNI
jgi:hypothetical protein